MNKLTLTNVIKRSLLSLTLLLSSIACHASIIFINEIHYDNKGSDKNEFVELAGTSGLNLMNWSLAFYNGSNGRVYKTVAIGDVSLNNTENGFGFHAVSVNGIQNGSNGGIGDGIALIDSSHQLRQFISYEGGFEATNGIAQGLFSQNINSIQSGSLVGMSLQLSGTGDSYQDFTWILANNTLGSNNASQHFTEQQKTSTVQISEPNLVLLFLLLIVLMCLANRRTKWILSSVP
jgi:hypothetical protein